MKIVDPPSSHAWQVLVLLDGTELLFGAIAKEEAKRGKEFNVFWTGHHWKEAKPEEKDNDL